MGIHPTAIVAPGAQIGDGCDIGPYCVVGPHVRLGAGTRLLAHVVVALVAITTALNAAPGARRLLFAAMRLTRCSSLTLDLI